MDFLWEISNTLRIPLHINIFLFFSIFFSYKNRLTKLHFSWWIDCACNYRQVLHYIELRPYDLNFPVAVKPQPISAFRPAVPAPAPSEQTLEDSDSLKRPPRPPYANRQLSQSSLGRDTLQMSLVRFMSLCTPSCSLLHCCSNSSVGQQPYCPCML